MDIVELLALRGLDTKAKIKLVRHQDKRYDVKELYRDGHLDAYQNYQGGHIFECDYVVSFIGLEDMRARFVGVYRVNGRRPASEVPVPNNFPYSEMITDHHVYYDLSPVAGFEDLRDRVVIDWGTAALAWHQWLRPKEVAEILPKGYVTHFPGYLDFVLRFDELIEIINHPAAHRDWHQTLSAVAGVYLIVDSKTGLQYVGAAYGKKGILGRWTVYARQPHGGNQLLKELLAKDGDHAHHFQFTILQTLPLTMTKKEVIEHEVIWKDKLGTRAFGLNSN